jgi:hypothetical protein
MHEGLTFGVYFPLLRSNPWEWLNVSFMGELGSTLSALYRTDAARAGYLLREFWSARTWIATMPQHMVRRLLLSETVAQTYRCIPEAIRRLLLMLLKNLYIDSFFCPFECDECAFFRRKGVSSRIDEKNHQILLDFIRRSNMDAF